MPDKLTDTRFVEVFNAGYAAIPAYGAMQVESAIEFGDAVEKERIVHNVQLPQEDSLTPTRVLFNGPIAIEPGEYGVGTRDYPALAKYDNAHHLAMQAGTPYGTLAGEPHLSFTQTGFVSLGVAKSSFGRPTFRVVPNDAAEKAIETHVNQFAFNATGSFSAGSDVEVISPINVDTDYLNNGVFVSVWCEVKFDVSSGSYSTAVEIKLQEQDNAGTWANMATAFQSLDGASETIYWEHDSTNLPFSPYTGHVSFDGYTRGSITDDASRLVTSRMRVVYNATDVSGIDHIRGGLRVMGLRDTAENRYNPIDI